MTCDDWFEAISAEVDGELHGAEVAAVAQHLAGCAHCRALEARLSAMRRRVILHVPAPVPDLSGAIVAQVHGTRAANRTLLHRTAAAVIVVIAAVAAFGLGIADRGGPAPSAPVDTATVGTTAHQFTDQEVHVTPGSTVNWENQGTGRHELVVDVGDATMSGTLAPGQSDSVTFDTPGTYDYHCEVHEGMTGTIVVES